ncbi:MAG: SRPBCC domain-containing protein [Flavobacteriales bacterium]|nr:SRPBCC domain-containing protein [Flavobacteriales bacterium]
MRRPDGRTRALRTAPTFVGVDTVQRIRDQVSTPAADELRITRVFDAPRELVWRAWTTPAMLVHWFGCAAFTTIDARADLREGGQWRVLMRAPDGTDFPAYGSYVAVRPIAHLAFTHQWEKPVAGVNPAHHRTLVTVDLHAEGPRTRMEFRQKGLATEASRDSHIGGWCDSMDKLAEAVVAG